MKKNNQKFLGFHKDKLEKWLIYWILLSVSFVVLLFFVTGTWIGLSVRDNCSLAQSKYQGDCVEALIQMVDDENNSFKQRNDAIWTLGQLGDKRAEYPLSKYYSENIPDREPYNEVLSTYELRKALNLLENDSSLTKFIWIKGLN